jgi:hypothetical protein
MKGILRRQKNIFTNYKSTYDTTMSFRIIRNNIYVSYFAFDMQIGYLMVINLETGNSKKIEFIGNDHITSSNIVVTEKGEKIYVLLDSSSNSGSYIIEDNSLKPVNLNIIDPFVNEKLGDLFK